MASQTGLWALLGHFSQLFPQNLPRWVFGYGLNEDDTAAKLLVVGYLTVHPFGNLIRGYLLLIRNDIGPV